MAALRRLRRTSRLLPRKSLLLFAVLVLVVFLSIAVLSLLNKGPQKNQCPQHQSPATVIASLVTPSNGHALLASFSALRIAKPCAVHLYVSSTENLQDLSHLSNTEACVFQPPSCPVRIVLVNNAHHWAHLPLTDVPPEANVIFIQPHFHISQPELCWLQRAHEHLHHHYAANARRNIAAFTIPCHHFPPSASPMNKSCAFSPVRSLPPSNPDLGSALPQEDSWAFFVAWLSSRRREWLLWPHIWGELSHVPNFWKGRSQNKRDKRLIWFGHRAGTDHSWADEPQQVFEKWYARWAANFSLSIVQAPIDLIGDESGPQVLRYADGREHVVTGPNDRKYLSLGSVWPVPEDPRFGEIYQGALKQILAGSPGTVSLTMVSAKFVELTRSWLCNVQRGGFMPDNVYWITLDEPSKSALNELKVGTTVDFTGAIKGENMDVVNILYGQPSYWRLMLLRTRLIRDLLDRGVDVFLFETDQVWLQDPMKFIRTDLGAGADMVGTLDTQHNIAGNTIFLRSVLATRRIWSEVYSRFLASYEEKNIDSHARNLETFVQHDQYQLSDLLMFNAEFRQDFPVALGLLNSQLFVGGSWYSGFYSSEESKRPIIINNNFISGTEKKKSRAIIFGHWFVQDDNRSCDMSAVDKALRYEFARLPGKWWSASDA